MNPQASKRYSASTRNLKSLLIIRSLVIGGMLLLLWYLADKSVAADSFNGMLVAVVALAAITLASFARLYHQLPVTDLEYALQLCADVAGLSIFLYYSGGASNPFVSYYLVPLVIAAAVLPRSFTAAIALLCTAAYSLLLFSYVPLPLFAPHGHGEAGAATVHVLGMWVNFLVSVGLITWFVVNMAGALRRQERDAVEQREDSLRNEQVLAVAGLAAGTAHELGTPLATMSVLLEDLLEISGEDAHKEDYRLLAQQVQRCKTILNKLARTAELSHIGETRQVAADDWLLEVLDHWQVMRPQASYRYQCLASGSAPRLQVEITLEQAVENLLNNAANACPDEIGVSLDWNDRQLTIRITDRGPGIPLELMDQLGKPVIRDGAGEGSGMGLGLLLSHATVNRYGGDITLTNRTGGGCEASIKLPLAKL